MTHSGNLKPNVLIICVDEMRADQMGCAGNRVVKTPNLDHLASEGILFQNPRDHGIRINGQSVRTDLPALPGVLAAAGYRTHEAGKLHEYSAHTPYFPIPPLELIEMAKAITPKQRMLNAYRGIPNDRPAVAPEFWYYYPARVLGVDMIEFQREVPFHVALKETFEKHACEGWGVVFSAIPNELVTTDSREYWIDDDTLEVKKTVHTPAGDLDSMSRYNRKQPSWSITHPVKNLTRDLPAWEIMALGGNVEEMDVSPLIQAWEYVEESYLLEAWLGVPFFDFFAGSLDRGFAQGIYVFMDPDFRPELVRLQEAYKNRLIQLARRICNQTPLESLCLGCSWSCNSLLGPELWRMWDKPVIEAVCREVHTHGKLLHIHFHGRCMDSVSDFAEIGIDCVCPFERPPGGDVSGCDGLVQVAQTLQNVTTMNGNVHTVETLIRGTPEDARREVREILDAFHGNPRVIVGTGDQVGGETPIENIEAMINEAKRRSI